MLAIEDLEQNDQLDGVAMREVFGGNWLSFMRLSAELESSIDNSRSAVSSTRANQESATSILGMYSALQNQAVQRLIY